MHSRHLEAKVIYIDDTNSELLSLFRSAYISVLDATKANLGVTVHDHDMLPSEKNTKKSKNKFKAKGIDLISVATGIDLSQKTVTLPAKEGEFEPSAIILIDEYDDYLVQVLLGKRTQKLYVSERKEKITDSTILLKELLYRFAFEILQSHNENERDGDSVLSGFNQFLDSLKQSRYFIGEKGVFRDSDFINLVETMDDWIVFFSACVEKIKILNANYDGISKGISFLTTRRNSLMTILVAKYLQFSKFDQSLGERVGAKICSSLGVDSSLIRDLKDVQAISDNNLARTLLNYEQEAFDRLSKKSFNKELFIQNNGGGKPSVLDFLLISLDDQRENLITMMDQYIQEYVKYDLFLMSTSEIPKIANLPKNIQIPTLIKCKEDFYVYGLSIESKKQVIQLNCIDSLKVIDFSVAKKIQISNILNHEIYHEILLKKGHIGTGYNNYLVLSLSETYNLIKNTNRLMKTLEKLASLTKAKGWDLLLSGKIKLDKFIIKLLNYSEESCAFIREFFRSEMVDIDVFEVLRSATIKNKTYSTFHLKCQSTDLISHLRRVTNPEFLRKLTCYFETEHNELEILEKLLDCSIIDDKNMDEVNQSTLSNSENQAETEVEKTKEPVPNNFPNSLVNKTNKPLLRTNRKGLASIPSENLEKLLELPDKLMPGTAVDDGGCFFDGLAQALNATLNTNSHTEKSLREACYKFYCSNKEEVSKWHKEDYNTTAKVPSYDIVQYTKEELDKDHHGIIPIWGRGYIEGRILCMVLNLAEIHLIELLVDPDSDRPILSHSLITKSGVNMIEGVNIPSYTKNIPILVLSQKDRHFIPILPKIETSNSPVCYSRTQENKINNPESLRSCLGYVPKPEPAIKPLSPAAILASGVTNSPLNTPQKSTTKKVQPSETFFTQEDADKSFKLALTADSPDVSIFYLTLLINDFNCQDNNLFVFRASYYMRLGSRCWDNALTDVQKVLAESPDHEQANKLLTEIKIKQTEFDTSFSM